MNRHRVVSATYGLSIATKQITEFKQIIMQEVRYILDFPPVMIEILHVKRIRPMLLGGTLYVSYLYLSLCCNAI